ncbi:MAG TPA: FGGY-family carbohydrate kinase, partial [Clostridiales bacterium]|nr:FGGY-family carbohydrate kinase [Clostridiales bacterium]
IEEFRERGCKLDHLRMIGGGSKSNLWTDIIANVTGAPVIRLKESEAACIGAAIIAGVGCGVFKDYSDACEHLVKDEIVTAIDTVKRDFYKAKYEKYKQGIKSIESYYQN